MLQLTTQLTEEGIIDPIVKKNIQNIDKGVKKLLVSKKIK